MLPLQGAGKGETKGKGKGTDESGKTVVVTMGTHVSFIFRGYNPYIGGSKPSFFMGFWGPRVVGQGSMSHVVDPPFEKGDEDFRKT